MKIFESKKIGRLALIAENNAQCEFGKDYILYYLYHLLSEVWDIEILLINQENRPLSSFLRECNAKAFTYSLDSIGSLSIPAASSGLIRSALEFRSDIEKSYSLYKYLNADPDYYDAYVFVGLTHAICSLLPLTRKRNCIVPLLFPRAGPIFGNNAAVRHALLNCDYFFCHSSKESQAVNALQPYAEVRCFPIMLDLEFIEKKIEPAKEMVLSEDYAIVIGECYNSTISHFISKLKQKGLDPIILLGDSISSDREIDVRGINLFEFAKHFSEIMSHAKIILIFMNKDFYPVLYNLSQFNVPLLISQNYAWNELLDGSGIAYLSFDQEITSAFNGRSSIMPPGYYHYKYYTNYFLKFINEWSIDNKLRFRAGKKQL